MPRYSVVIHRKVIQTVNVIVDADDADQANYNAIALANNHPEKIPDQWATQSQPEDLYFTNMAFAPSLVNEKYPLTGEPKQVDPEDEFLSEMRKEIRTELLAEILMGNLPQDLEYYVTFSGYGDSGSLIDCSDMPHKIIDFLCRYEEFADAEGYENDEGGGCTVLWKVFKDEILVDSYYNNVTESEQYTVMVL